MTKRNQKKKAEVQQVSIDQETLLNGNDLHENPIAGTSKSPKVQAENLEDIKSTLGKEILSDLTTILAENQEEMLQLIAPVSKKQATSTVPEESDSEPENFPPTITSTPTKPGTTTVNQKTTQVNDRNMVTRVLNDSTNLGKKKTLPHRPPNVCHPMKSATQ